MTEPQWTDKGRELMPEIIMGWLEQKEARMMTGPMNDAGLSDSMEFKLTYGHRDISDIPSEEELADNLNGPEFDRPGWATTTGEVQDPGWTPRKQRHAEYIEQHIDDEDEAEYACHLCGTELIAPWQVCEGCGANMSDRTISAEEIPARGEWEPLLCGEVFMDSSSVFRNCIKSANHEGEHGIVE